jgi:hypothetical protein
MARSYAYWVIISGSIPTAFRAKRREDLIPTLKQLQRKQPSTVLKWFERGRLWSSQLEAEDALKLARQQPVRRSREWRPGGDHKDPRARVEVSRDQKRARFKRRLIQGRSASSDDRGAPAAGRPPAKPRRPPVKPRGPKRHT